MFIDAYIQNEKLKRYIVNDWRESALGESWEDVVKAREIICRELFNFSVSAIKEELKHIHEIKFYMVFESSMNKTGETV